MFKYILYVLIGMLQSITVLANSDPKVLLLNSYHAQYRWTAELTKGVQQVITQQIAEENLHIEFMDQRRFMDDQLYYERAVALYRYKYAVNKPDVIITSDDPAYYFLLEYGDTIFPGVPIIFCGVNVFLPELLAGHDNITGIQEGESIDESIALITQVQPQLERLIILADNTGLGLRLYQEAQKAKKRFLDDSNNRKITIEIFDQFNKQELAERAAGLDTRSAILLLAIHRDNEGNYFSYDKDVPFLSKHSNAPIYGMWGTLIEDTGVLGGMMNNPYLHGQNTAKLALRIINGEQPANIPIKDKADYRPSFNYQQLQRFNIDMSLLPEDSNVVGQPETLYHKYSTVVNSALSTIVGLIIIIGILFNNILQRRESQKKLKNFNRKLEYMVHERTRDIDEKNLALEKAKQELQTLAFTDSLTHLANRRSGSESLEQCLLMVKDKNYPMSLALLDLDHFKSINDKLGHLVGDQVLVAVAAALTRAIGPVNTVYRWGGEEFLILFPKTCAQQAHSICLEIANSLSLINIPDVGDITASIGLTHYIEDDTSDILLQVVDDALYQAKANGRNQIVMDARVGDGIAAQPKQS